jgi:hypothetical protein
MNTEKMMAMNLEKYLRKAMDTYLESNSVSVMAMNLE